MSQTDIVYNFCQNMNNMRFTRHFPANKCLVSWDGKETLNFFCDETLQFKGQEEIGSFVSLDKLNEIMLNYSTDYRDEE